MNSSLKKNENKKINAFVINVFLGPLRNPRQNKNKPVIGFPLVIM